jgi:hypothetical protein
VLTPLLQRLGNVLDEAGAAWSVVREESGPRIDDVTLHVAPSAAAAVVDALDRCGFAPLGSGTDHLAPDGPRWLRVRLDSGGQLRRTRTTSRGVTVALLGPDGVGKSTLLAGLAADYPLAIRQIYMGMWQGAGQSGYTRLDAVRAILIRPFRVWWRVACGAVHVARGRVVVFWPLLKRPYFWILAHLAPRPDLVLVLDLPGEVAFARKGESTPERLEAVRQGFLALVPRLGAEVVDAAAPPDQVRADVVARIWRRHRARLAGDPVSRPRPAARTAAPSAPEPAPPATPR